MNARKVILKLKIEKQNENHLATIFFLTLHTHKSNVDHQIETTTTKSKNNHQCEMRARADLCVLTVTI